MALKSLNDIIARVSAGYGRNIPGAMHQYPSTNGAGQQGVAKGIHFPLLPSPLPSGVTGWIPTAFTGYSAHTNATSSILVAGTNLGTVNYGASSFTDGSAMPTRRELGTNGVATWGAVFMEVTTALNGGAGTAQITYTDQDGNTGNTVNLDVGGSAVKGSCFMQYTYATGDYGVRDVTACSYSGQSSPQGVVKLWGITPLGMIFSGPNEGQQGFLDLIGGDFAFMSFPVDTEFFTINMGTSERTCFADLFIVGDN